MNQKTDNLFTFSWDKLLETAIDSGSKPLGYTCSYVPPVLLSAGSLFPYRVNAKNVNGTEVADIYLSQVTCSYTRSVLEYVMDDQLEFLQGWVFAAGCDHLRRLYDNLQYLISPDFCHIIDVPHKSGPDAIDWYEQELRSFSRSLSEYFKVDMSEPAISQKIYEYNTLMNSLTEISNYRKIDSPPFSGAEFQKLMTAVWTLPLEVAQKIVKNIKQNLDKRSCPINFRARVLIISSVIDHYEWIECIENVGALVVADRFCTGAIPGIEAYPETENPFHDIAAHTLQTNACPRMMDTYERRIDLILETIHTYQVDGVIIAPMKFCDIWGVESSQLMNLFKDKGIPVLRLEREYRLSGEGQLYTRVQAFLEQMKL
ncbi:2-hydroxyglutaryl-CoA dehydratase, D-component [Candidatus Magnetomorum sp. HK-1]|nr:2-hydroxyglutaryl-CoA dehydratase, D-component [Candidatus Magnetomorum sp. HK-1]